jgi:hypothetical protein
VKTRLATCVAAIVAVAACNEPTAPRSTFAGKWTVQSSDSAMTLSLDLRDTTIVGGIGDSLTRYYPGAAQVAGGLGTFSLGGRTPAGVECAMFRARSDAGVLGVSVLLCYGTITTQRIIATAPPGEPTSPMRFTVRTLVTGDRSTAPNWSFTIAR